MGRNIFFLTVQENGTLWDSLYMFNTPSSIQGNVSYSRNVSRHNLSTDFIILLSSTQILESSWICVSFIKHKIRKTVYPILSRFRKKVSFDLFGWTACLIKKFESRLVFLNLYDGQVNKAKLNYHQSRRNWRLSQIFGGTFVFRVMQGGRLSGRHLFSRTCLHFFWSNFVGLFDAEGQSHKTVYALHRFMLGIYR